MLVVQFVCCPLKLTNACVELAIIIVLAYEESGFCEIELAACPVVADIVAKVFFGVTDENFQGR
jgi:hypothetical protein